MLETSELHSLWIFAKLKWNESISIRCNMVVFYRTFLLAYIMILHNKSVSTKSINVMKEVPKFPKLMDFFKKKSDIKKHSKLSQCEVEVRKEQCISRVVPVKRHCLLLNNIVIEIMPQYRIMLNRAELINYRMLPVTEIFINTCNNRITFKTSL